MPSKNTRKLEMVGRHLASSKRTYEKLGVYVEVGTEAISACFQELASDANPDTTAAHLETVNHSYSEMQTIIKELLQGIHKLQTELKK